MSSIISSAYNAQTPQLKDYELIMTSHVLSILKKINNTLRTFPGSGDFGGGV